MMPVKSSTLPSTQSCGYSMLLVSRSATTTTLAHSPSNRRSMPDLLMVSTTSASAVTTTTATTLSAKRTLSKPIQAATYSTSPQLPSEKSKHRIAMAPWQRRASQPTQPPVKERSTSSIQLLSKTASMSPSGSEQIRLIIQ